MGSLVGDCEGADVGTVGASVGYREGNPVGLSVSRKTQISIRDICSHPPYFPQKESAQLFIGLNLNVVTGLSSSSSL